MSNHVDISIRRRKQYGDVLVVISDDYEKDHVEISASEFAYMKNDDVAFLRHIVENTGKGREMMSLAMKTGDFVRTMHKGRELQFEESDVNKALSKKKISSYGMSIVNGSPAATLSIASNDDGKTFFVEVVGWDYNNAAFINESKRTSFRLMISNADRDAMISEPKEFLRRMMFLHPRVRYVLNRSLEKNSKILIRDISTDFSSSFDKKTVEELYEKAIQQANIFVVPNSKTGKMTITVSCYGFSHKINDVFSEIAANVGKDPSPLLETISEEYPRAIEMLASQSKKGIPVFIRKGGAIHELDREELLRHLPEKNKIKKPPIVFSYNPNRF